MSEFNVTVDGGNSIRLKTAGKYCDRDIVVTAEGGTDERFKQLVDGTITEVRDSEITTIDAFAFYGRQNLVTVDLPNVTTIGQNAFNGCTNLATVDCQNVTSLGGNAFANCSSLVSVNFPKITEVDGTTFGNCSKLQAINLPNATYIGYSVFRDCYKLQAINFPKVTGVDEYAFRNCRSLVTADFPKLTGIYLTCVFENCYSLKAVILRNDAICRLESTSSFKNCYHILGTKNSTYNPNGDKDGYFYVQRKWLSDDDATMDYRRTTNWSTYSTQFRALEDYTVDGTTTGELDWEKVNA